MRLRFQSAAAERLRIVRTATSAVVRMLARYSKRSPSGARPRGRKPELQAHHKLNAHQIPLDLLRAPEGEEHRAITGAPTNVATMQESPIQPVFAQGSLAYLGVDMPSVPTGDAVFPVLTTRPVVRGPFTGSDVAAETDGSFDAALLAPERIQASFSYLRSDAARFASMGESLREALNSGLTEKVDQDGINGTNGLLEGANLANHNVAAITSFATYISAFGYGRVDGRFAPSARDLRVLMGSATYGHMGTVYKSTETDISAIDRLMFLLGPDNVRVSAHVPAPSGNKQNSIIRLGMRRDMVCPMWEGISLIYDEITGRTKGEISITAVLLFTTKILRAGGFYKQQSQHA